ncbi:hypothetical protein CC78DRAFT_585090 [Lojkania enalia]|uniref:Uncharacterized protein n=1 Tax=Lojkania enalia TaxID=147567 RepID=A0A9P4K4X2_9PLEO|nr:hypothetical protein CC78DRAFT_585090 [Didymosphaeria enalia]
MKSALFGLLFLILGKTCAYDGLTYKLEPRAANNATIRFGSGMDTLVERADSCGSFATKCGAGCCALSKFCCDSKCCNSSDDCTYDRSGNGVCVTCETDEYICGVGCAPKGTECCGISSGSKYCGKNYNCCGSSCCPEGTKCLQGEGGLYCEGKGAGGTATAMKSVGIAKLGMGMTALLWNL